MLENSWLFKTIELVVEATPHPAFPGIDQETAYRSGTSPDAGGSHVKVTVPLSTEATRLDGALIVKAGNELNAC